MEQESIKQTVDKAMEDIAAKREEAMGKPEQADGKDAKKFDEITIKFGKGLVGEEFQGKDGNSYKEIKIPNVDKNDHRPWQSFVVKANHVHENQFGKGMWVKLPAEGHTTVQRSVVIGEKPDGKKEWGKEKTTMANRDLKKVMESYKERSSMKEKLTEKKAEVAQQKPAEKVAQKSKEAAL